MTTIPVPPFNIACEFHSLKQSGFGENAPPDDEDELFITISTPQDKWHSRCKRKDMARLFDHINSRIPTPVEFGATSHASTAPQPSEAQPLEEGAKTA